jgi:hypothetical protein
MSMPGEGLMPAVAVRTACPLVVAAPPFVGSFLWVHRWNANRRRPDSHARLP